MLYIYIYILVFISSIYHVCLHVFIYIYTYLSQKWPIREGTERKKWKHPTLEAARPGGAPMASCCHWFHCWLLYHSGSAWTKLPNNPSTDWLKNSGIMDSMTRLPHVSFHVWIPWLTNVPPLVPAWLCKTLSHQQPMRVGLYRKFLEAQTCKHTLVCPCSSTRHRFN